jgi:hypothetical protein
MLQTKEEQGENWTPEQQKDLDGLNEALTLLGYTEEGEQPTPNKGFAPPERDKRKIFLKIRKGTKFDPNTGKPIGVPYVQAFTYGEWNNFKNNYSKLGYTVLEVLYDPYGEAEKIFKL